MRDDDGMQGSGNVLGKACGDAFALPPVLLSYSTGTVLLESMTAGF